MWPARLSVHVADARLLVVRRMLAHRTCAHALARPVVTFVVDDVTPITNFLHWKTSVALVTLSDWQSLCMLVIKQNLYIENI